jgi:predicted aspartyl protease
MMVRRLHALAAVLMAALLSGCAGAGGGDSCALEPWATVPVDTTAGVAIVPARVDGKLVHMVLDTGAQVTILTTAAAERIDLARDFRHMQLMRAAAGTSVAGQSAPATFAFAGIAMTGVRLRVGAFPLPTLNGMQPDGLLGGDFLSALDVDLDFPHGRVVLYRARPCPGAPPPFSGAYATVPMAPSEVTRVVLPVVLDGQAMTALLDTGASATVVSLRGARRAGITDAAIATGPQVSSHAASSQALASHALRFTTLRIGDEVLDNPVLLAGDIDLGQPDLLLGLNYLRRHRVFLSYATRTAYIARGP